jgi:ankyrin repeat protein
MTVRPHVLTRILRAKPDLAQLKRQARELLAAFVSGKPAAIAEVNSHFQGAKRDAFALHDAQLVLARAYGFPSWPKLKAFVDGVTVQRFAEAAGTGDLATVRRMTSTRPELVHLDVAASDEHQALHHAVIGRHPDVVRFLMRHGADARKGIYPQRDATSALTMAIERGYTEIEGIIREEEARRAVLPPAVGVPGIEALRAAFQRDDEDAVIASLTAHPELTRAGNQRGRTALHWAAGLLWERLAAWLIGHGADVNERATNGDTPLDVIGSERDLSGPDTAGVAARLVRMLRARGATPTAKGAVAAGDADWLRREHAVGRLLNQTGLASQAVSANRPDMLALLLELGYDADEAGLVGGLEETVPTWGDPLRSAAIRGSLEMVRILLAHGANPNTNVYAASCALSEAHQRGHRDIVTELERHGGRLWAIFVADLGLIDQVRTLLADDPEKLRRAGLIRPGTSLQSELLWAAIGRPSPEIVELTLEHTNWSREDPVWFGILENGLYQVPKGERSRRRHAFKLVLDRADPNLAGAWGATLLHYMAANRGDLDADDRLAVATMLIDAGARLDVRDSLLKSTPLGWACRWGRSELVTLFLERGADPLEPGAEEWARPEAWATTRGHRAILGELRARRR